MKKALCLIGLFLFASLFNIKTVQAAPRRDAQKIARLLHSKELPKGLIYSERGCSSQDEKQCFSLAKNGEEYTIVVFIYKGVRYTIRTEKRGKNNYHRLSIWTRPNGTHSDKNLKEMQDIGTNGRVDFALIGKDSSDVSEKIYRSEKMRGGAIGAKYRHYWQRLYDKAIAAAIKHFKL